MDGLSARLRRFCRHYSIIKRTRQPIGVFPADRRLIPLPFLHKPPYPFSTQPLLHFYQMILTKGAFHMKTLTLALVLVNSLAFTATAWAWPWDKKCGEGQVWDKTSKRCSSAVGNVAGSDRTVPPLPGT